MRPPLRAAPLVLLLAACGAPSVAPAPAPPALAYAVPRPPTIEYVVRDSARAEIRAAGQSFALDVLVGERWRMEFAGADSSLRVTATLTDLDARLSNPLSAPQTADESAVTGSVVFTLDPRGRARVETLPTVTPAVAQFLSGSGIAHTFFPRLPARAVTPGATWTDTVAYTTEEGGARIDVSSVTTHTAAGDSLVDGTTLLLVRTEGTTTQSSTGAIGGTSFEQVVSGATSGHFLWDPAAGALHALEVRSDLSGTMAVAIVPVGLDVRVRSLVQTRRAAPGG